MAKKSYEYKGNQISGGTNLLINLMFIVYCILCLYPLLLILGVSFTDEASLLEFGYRMIPKKFSVEAYSYLFRNFDDIKNAYQLTIFVTVVGTFLSVLSISFYAYPLSRTGFKYKKFFTFFAFFTMIFNGGMVPWYVVCTKVLGLQDSVWGLILPYCMNAWHVIILRTFFSTTVPDSIIESAKIDGAGEFKIFRKIVLPLSLPGIATIALFSTLKYWNDWWLPMMLTTNTKLSNLQYLLQKIVLTIEEMKKQGEQASAQMVKTPTEGARMAICILAIGPIIFAYPFFQRYFVRGLTIGAVKG